MPDFTKAVWRKATASGGNGACVEVARAPSATAIRDTKNREAGYIVATTATFEVFLADLKAGKYDL